ncbi:MAG: hypothetical protein IBX63_10410 [Coriobacteriia bacterium]|nr:hypothetical protein [Coriobacteriia bacterium]
MVVQFLWLRLISPGALSPPAAFVAALLVARCVINFALGYYAEPALKWLLPPRESFYAVLSLTVALTVFYVFLSKEDGLAWRQLSSLVTLAALGAGAWRRLASSRPSRAA